MLMRKPSKRTQDGWQACQGGAITSNDNDKAIRVRREVDHRVLSNLTVAHTKQHQHTEMSNELDTGLYICGVFDPDMPTRTAITGGKTRSTVQ